MAFYAVCAVLRFSPDESQPVSMGGVSLSAEVYARF